MTNRKLSILLLHMEHSAELFLLRVSVHSMQSAILFYHFCLSVCPSVRHTVVLYQNECIYIVKFFHLLVKASP